MLFDFIKYISYALITFSDQCYRVCPSISYIPFRIEYVWFSVQSNIITLIDYQYLYEELYPHEIIIVNLSKEILTQ
jgi:hypothetical protein